MALSKREQHEAAHEAGFVAGFEDAATQILNLLTDAEHEAFYATGEDARMVRTTLLVLIDAVKELEYGAIPTYEES